MLLIGKLTTNSKLLVISRAFLFKHRSKRAVKKTVAGRVSLLESLLLVHNSNSLWRWMTIVVIASVWFTVVLYFLVFPINSHWLFMAIVMNALYHHYITTMSPLYHHYIITTILSSLYHHISSPLYYHQYIITTILSPLYYHHYIITTISYSYWEKSHMITYHHWSLYSH